MDPDKKVYELQKKKDSIYQSNGHPEHFENEGAEFGANKNAEQSDNNKTKEEADFDKMNGSKT
jgi:hypothetical protein